VILTVLGAVSVLAALAVARIRPFAATGRPHLVPDARAHPARSAVLTILFPAAHSAYTPGSWRVGCARGLGLCGTARYVRGLTIAVAIQQLGTGRYWNGRAFVAPRVVYNRARLSRRQRRGRRARRVAWYYGLALPGPAGGYAIAVRASARQHRHARRLAHGALTFTVAPSSTPSPPSPPVSTPPATFTIAGDAAGTLYPGGPAQSLSLTLTNPAASAIHVTSLSTVLESTGLPAGCSTANFRLVQAGLPSGGLGVPAHGTVALTGSGATPPSIQMTDASADQDACAGAHLTLSYAGSGHS
jgi:hypothetical protein